MNPFRLKPRPKPIERIPRFANGKNSCGSFSNRCPTPSQGKNGSSWTAYSSCLPETKAYSSCSDQQNCESRLPCSSDFRTDSVWLIGGSQPLMLRRFDD